jgi:quaternary ammonium compound-resistance protein SugE
MTTKAAWLYLLLAGLCEMAWPIGYKYSNGFSLTKPWHTGGTVAFLLVSFWLMSLAARQLPVGTVYAVWTGIGATGTTLLGILLFKESRTPARLVCLGLVIVGVIGLKFFSGQSEQHAPSPESRSPVDPA